MDPSCILRVGLIGDHDLSVTAHRAIEQALPLTAESLGLDLEYVWLSTNSIDTACLSDFSGLWCVPGSSYRNTERALAAIRYVRENSLPFLGTCGGPARLAGIRTEYSGPG